MYNEALLYPSYEITGGEKFLAPSANSYHNNTMGVIYAVISNYVRKNKCGFAFTDSLDVRFPDGSTYRPDLMVVTTENKNIIDWQGNINGAPDMVVEALSKSTMKKDFTVKKDTYEKFGVKEYWIVNSYMKTISVYILRDGKFELDMNDYTCYSEYEFENLNDEEKAAVRSEISPSIFPEIKINLHDIFDLY